MPTEAEGVVVKATTVAVTTAVAMTVAATEGTIAAAEEGLLVWGKLQSAPAPQGTLPYTVPEHMTLPPLGISRQAHGKLSLLAPIVKLFSHIFVVVLYST